MDHDQRFKVLIREFFAEFMRLFFASWAARLDLTSVDWLDKEVLPNPPEGSRHFLDLIAKVAISEKARELPDSPKSLLALVHIEVESPDRTTRLKPRFPAYYLHLRDQNQLPVLPVAVYLGVGLDGIGVDEFEERFWEFQILRFRYLYVGLPSLDGLEYVAGNNWLGVALSALMRIPPDRAAWLGAEALRRLAEAPLNEQQRFLLADCVEAYLPLDESQRQEFERLLAAMPVQEKVNAMNKTTFEKGIEKGQMLTLQRVAQRQLEAKFRTTLTSDAQQRLSSRTPEELEKLAIDLLSANSLKELGLEG